MKSDDYKGFRYGVRNIDCSLACTLVELVASELAGKLAGKPASSDLRPIELIELGAVYVNDERSLNPSQGLQPGDRIRIHAEPRRFAAPADLLSRIIREDADSLLIDKPAGLPTEATVDNVKENLLAFLEDLRGQHFFLTHRLAPESDGLLWLAKSPEAMNRITRSFAEGRVRRRYAAFVETPLSTGERPRFSVLSCEEWRAETNLISEGRQSWQIEGAPLKLLFRLQIEFTKARPKEIREELAAVGAPIVGDRAYGSRVLLVHPVTSKPALAFQALSLALDP